MHPTISKPYDSPSFYLPPPPRVTNGHLALARIENDVCLVQVSSDTPASALTTVDVNIFRHEFISIFRLSETKSIHPSDISIIEILDDYQASYEEDNGTVYLTKELIYRMQHLSRKLQALNQQKSAPSATRRPRPSRWSVQLASR